MVVSADTIRTAVGVIGNATALVLFFSPAIWKSRSVEQFPAAPYLAALLNCMMWVLYGLPMVHPHSTLVLTINGSGLVIELVYVLVFLGCSHGDQRLRVLSVLLVEVALVGAVGALILTLVHGHERRSLIAGVLCVIFGTGMYAAPLCAMVRSRMASVITWFGSGWVQRQVIRTRSVEFMPLPLSLASFLNGLCWTTYATIRFDLYITIPNGLGVAFAVAQLALHVVYRGSTARQKKGGRREAEIGPVKPSGSGGLEEELANGMRVDSGVVSVEETNASSVGTTNKHLEV
ncbi:sugar transmembrane transporter [Musa troglodytarum]|uniref:Bidirectional sugar transporter SWEET n=1 Tax=Musa troglodytarum TaxID=320322 RepID=A0A9E7J9I3_9LILI|nr:sugar transmembrane transporter [Musa troglodytarum]